MSNYSSTSWYFNRTVVMLSGGWDSAYCLFKAVDEFPGDVLSVFCDYGQPYSRSERAAARYLASLARCDLQEVSMAKIESDGGVFLYRNATLLSMIARGQPSRVYFGTRNILPIFDRYKDSNWFWAKCFGQVYGVEVRTPCVLLPKRSIIEAVVARGVDVSKVYSTEKGYRSE